MTNSNFTRRSVLRQGSQLTAAGVALFALSACGDDKPKVQACADPVRAARPKGLNSGQKH